MTVATSDIFVPRSHKFALAKPEWKLAMEAEIKALHHNNNVISAKWIFKMKQNKDGSIEHFKACLVANGMHQVHGHDYLDTFSPVVQPLYMRLILTLAITNGWHNPPNRHF